MRWRAASLGVAAALAASVWMAPAANAQVRNCLGGALPEQNVVTIGPGQITISPGNVAPYAGVVADYAAAAVLCVVNETAGPAISCAKTLVANRPTVTIDPQTLEITIDYSEFLGTACSL